MERPRVSVKKLAIILTVAFVTLTLLMGVIALLINGNPYEETIASSEEPSSSEVSSLSSEVSSLSSEVSSLSSEVSSLSSETELIESESEPEPEPVKKEYTPNFNMPSELRGVVLTAGVDYATDPAATAAAIASQIDQAIASAKQLTMNTIIVSSYAQPTVFDSLDYIVTKAHENGLYVFLCQDVRVLTGTLANYKPDAILLDGYSNPADAAGYENYLVNGGGMGYENYLKSLPKILLRTAANEIREKAPDTQVGLLSNAVWENSAVNSEGSETSSLYTDLTTGNTDTRALLREGLFDCVLVKNYGSTNEQPANFGVVANWWAKEAKQDNVALYMLHASDRLGTQSVGWNVYEQLTKQIIDLEKIPGISGSAFNSLKALVANPNNSTTTLVQYMNDQINEEYVLTQLAVSKPDKLTFNTKEQSVIFQGASDPQEKVMLNDQEIPTNESGYFTILERLNPGVNKFVITHKSKSLTYTITREVDVLKEIQPVGNMTVEGGMTVRVTALAYEGATISASIGGQPISLSPTEDLEDEELRNSGYILYSGSFTAPVASSSAVNMGKVTVTATAQGTSKTMTGASVTVNKLVAVGNGGAIQITAEEAETFPIGTLDDTSSPACYPLPAGTIDITAGDPIVYNTVANGEAKTYKYWKLESGARVYSTDMQSINASVQNNNKISKMSIQSSSAYTQVKLNTQQKVPYSVSYDGSNIVFSFKYTTSVPDSVKLKDNALFSAAQWNDSNLTLCLRKSGGFIGYKAYYEVDTLVLRFNNPNGMRVVVDPGHGGNDPGATGFYPGKNEADINLAISQKLVAELQGRGASVLMLNPGTTMESRMAAARAFNPQVLVSIHGNSSRANPAAVGTEVYYFYPFAKALAANIAANTSASLDSTNRGAKSGLYYMTRESQFAAVLVETGFVTNESEYTKLINAKYQSRIAKGIANGISGYLGGANSGGGTGGTNDEEEIPELSSSEEEKGAETILDNEEREKSIEIEGDSHITIGDRATYTAIVTPSKFSDVEWWVEDNSILAITNDNSDSCRLEAIDVGETYLCVASKEDSNLERRFLISVVE